MVDSFFVCFWPKCSRLLFSPDLCNVGNCTFFQFLLTGKVKVKLNIILTTGWITIRELFYSGLS